MALCPRCGGKRRRNRKLKAYYCRRCGFLPSGRFLNPAGRETTAEERAAMIARVSLLREVLEGSRG